MTPEQVKKEVGIIAGFPVKELSFDGSYWQGTLVNGVNFQFDPVQRFKVLDQQQVLKLFEE